MQLLIHFNFLAKVISLPILLIATNLFLVTPLNAEAAQCYEHRAVNIGDYNMSYMDFGGTGPTLIWVMDLHNYFENPEISQDLINLLCDLTDTYRVLAPIRRGYEDGQQDKWVFSLDRQAHDLLSFMDGIGIEKAILFSSMPGTQDLIYLAEHHPHRISAMVFQGGHLIYPGNSHPLVNEFYEYFYAGSCDLGERYMHIIGPRLSYRPHFMDDSSFHISVPLLIMRIPGYDDRSLMLGWADNITQVSGYHFCGNEKAKNYFTNLSQDSLAYWKVKSALVETDITLDVQRRMYHAFQEFQTVVELDLTSEIAPQKNLAIRRFLKALK